jgi:hypothetical protein
MFEARRIGMFAMAALLLGGSAHSQPVTSSSSLLERLAGTEWVCEDVPFSSGTEVPGEKPWLNFHQGEFLDDCLSVRPATGEPTTEYCILEARGMAVLVRVREEPKADPCDPPQFSTRSVAYRKFSLASGGALVVADRDGEPITTCQPGDHLETFRTRYPERYEEMMEALRALE